MKTVTNKTRAPVKVPLPGDKILRLAPGSSGQIRDEAADHPALLRLVEEGKVSLSHGPRGGLPGGGGHNPAAFRGRSR
jgi:hypothetical protein